MKMDQTMDYFAHESSYIDENAVIGSGTKIWHFCHILSDTRIGTNCSLGQNVQAGPGVTIGNGCKIQNNVSIYKGVLIEDDVFLGPSMVFTNILTPRAFVTRKDEFLPTIVRKGASIGANATIVCGITIGAYAMIGAGCVVTRNVPPYGLVTGVPARQRGWVCRCGEVLHTSNREGCICDNFVCKRCALQYVLSEGAIQTV